jgi:hypothetical protein
MSCGLATAEAEAGESQVLGQSGQPSKIARLCFKKKKKKARKTPNKR